MESHESKTSESELSVREFRGEIFAMASTSCAARSHRGFCQSRHEEATSESQRRWRFEKLQGDSESSQDSLNNWDEMNLNTIQGVCVDDSIGTSISSASEVTEPAISHPPQAGCDPSCFN